MIEQLLKVVKTFYVLLAVITTYVSFVIFLVVSKVLGISMPSQILDLEIS